jgi:hypothetical protein
MCIRFQTQPESSVVLLNGDHPRKYSLSAYHPQTDGQTECVNQELKQYLWVFVSEQQDNWMELLPLTEFQYNNHVHASTQHSLFFINTEHHPHMGFEPNEAPSHMETVNEFWDQIVSTLEEAKSALAKAKNDMAQYYNCCCTLAPVYEIGDMVYLDSWDICTTQPSQKLAHCYLRPYKVEKCVGAHACCLKLPDAMSCLHPVFHVVKLLPALQDPIPG